MDTTEARYAEIARKMVELGDWITPWFDYGEPFWAKPPLSFWMTAASFKVLGVSAFVARLPHWLCSGLVAWAIWSWLARRSRREAVYALALLTGSIVFFVSAGAVMTDMALALGTTLAMRGFWLGLHGAPAERRREQHLFFLGIAVGLMAKGPVAAALVGIPIAMWSLGSGDIGRVLRTIDWGRGLLLTLALVVPWYAWAEWRTPGFLEYFVVGEHLQRFVTPGWRGDLYGNAHAFPRGSIWLFGVVAFLPWSLLLPVAAWRWRRLAGPTALEDRSLYGYLLLWALTPCVFFSLAGNILWTYVLPGLPALAMVTALWLARLPRRLLLDQLLAGGVACTVLAIVGLVTGINLDGWADKKSTLALVSDYDSHRSADEALVFLGRRPFSAAFYSQGRAESVCCNDDLQSRLNRGPVFVAVKSDDLNRLPEALVSQFRFVSRQGDYQLFLAVPGPEDTPAPGVPP
jgi:4-amino-4-deoxy-L-arabinose transferase-like glycosyltransferase